MTLHDIQVGTARASLRFHRDDTGRTEVEIVESDGLTILRPRAIPRGHDRITAAMRAVLAPLTANRL